MDQNSIAILKSIKAAESVRDVKERAHITDLQHNGYITILDEHKTGKIVDKIFVMLTEKGHAFVDKYEAKPQIGQTLGPKLAFPPYMTELDECCVTDVVYPDSQDSVDPDGDFLKYGWLITTDITTKNGGGYFRQSEFHWPPITK